MILYSENPKLRNKVVTTVLGDKEYRINCRCIQGQYYRKGRDCFLIGTTYYRKESPKITMNYTSNEYVLLKTATETLHKGFVDGKGTVGYFEWDFYRSVEVRGAEVNCLKDIAFAEDLGLTAFLNFDFVATKDYTLRKPTLIANLTTVMTTVKYSDHNYNSDDNQTLFMESIRLFQEAPFSRYSKYHKYAKEVEDLTWGIEFEVSSGTLPVHLQKLYGVIPCRDGSITDSTRGGELVTIPYTGARGIAGMIGLCKELSLRTIIDTSCSLHIHIGNVPTDRNFILANFLLMRTIQDSLFAMVPYYKTAPQGIKAKNYCQKLPDLQIQPLQVTALSKSEFNYYIQDSFDKLFTWLSDGCKADFDLHRGMDHPVRSKWNRKSRYFYVNYQNLFFGPRRTIEFRLHQGTTNAYKVLFWLLITTACIKYTKKYMSQILRGKIPYSIVEVLKASISSKLLLKAVLEYYDDRVKFFKMLKVNKDDRALTDIEQDQHYKSPLLDI